jgi:hypothetical protein
VVASVVVKSTFAFLYSLAKEPYLRLSFWGYRCFS